MTDISIEHLVGSAIQNSLMDLDVCLPVTIESYDSKLLTANVSPDFDVEFDDGELADQVVIQEVPICFPMTSSKAIIFPLEPGDKAVLICAQRSLDNWKLGFRPLKDSTMFQLGNGFLIPGVSHKLSLAKHLLHKPEAMNILSDKLFFGDPTAIINPLLASKGLKQRDLVGILAVLVELLASVQYGGPGGPPAPFGGVDPTALSILQAIGKELKELSAQ